MPDPTVSDREAAIKVLTWIRHHGEDSEEARVDALIAAGLLGHHEQRDVTGAEYDAIENTFEFQHGYQIGLDDGISGRVTRTPVVSEQNNDKADATPDEAFDLGRVKGYDEAITDAIDWARSQSGWSADRAADYIEEMAAMIPVDRPTEEVGPADV